MEDPDHPEVVPESYEPIEGPGGNDKSSIKYANVSTDRWPEYCNPHYKMPDVIDVKVTIGTETYIFPVHVSKPAATKPYFGGYRNKINGAIYHHASTQTPTENHKKLKDYSSLRTRETQTVEYRTLSVQNTRESGTQMERIDLKLDNRRDQVIIAKSYFTSDELMIKKKAATVLIQRYWRGFMARRRAQLIRQRNVDYQKKLQDEKAQREAADAEVRMRDLARRAHPRSSVDFEVLYKELDTWRLAEVQKIKNSIVDPNERKSAMHELLLNETKALQHLQHLKLSAAQEMHDEKTQLMLSNMSAPLRWQMQNGTVAHVHTPETQRAKQLLELYNRLNAPVESIDTRLEILVKVKWEVETNDSIEAAELMSLLDREADLLSRRRPVKSMHNLRLRSSHLFLQMIQAPEFNPRAADFVKEKV